MISKTHHFFLLPLSAWALMSSASAFNLLFSLLMFFKFSFSDLFFMNVLNISLISFLWWLNYSGEFYLKGDSSFLLEGGLKTSMILFISSEVFFFFSFFWSYFHFFLSPTTEISEIWPPQLINMFDALNVPLINTLVLLSSGLTVTLSHYFLTEGKSLSFKFNLILTVILGLFFSYLQSAEYASSFFSINDGTFGTTFFMLTGFHGMHVLIGTIFLLSTLIRSTLESVSKSCYLSFEMASWYWHFVDVVWIFLYFFLYYMNN